MLWTIAIGIELRRCRLPIANAHPWAIVSCFGVPVAGAGRCVYPRRSFHGEVAKDLAGILGFVNRAAFKRHRNRRRAIKAGVIEPPTVEDSYWKQLGNGAAAGVCLPFHNRNGAWPLLVFLWRRLRSRRLLAVAPVASLGGES